MKDLTIVVPLYNKVHYIEQCLGSIKNSTHSIDWECIVVDDGSTDGSTDIAKKFCNENCDNFTYIQCLRNHGPYPSYARNVGIRMAESEFIMFFDADDWLCDGYPERGVKYMKEHPECDLYNESVYTVHFERNYGEYIEFYQFFPDKVDDFGFDGFMQSGGGLYTRGIFKTSEVKKHRFKDVLLEDSIFMADYLFPGKKIKTNLDNFSFYYFTCRSEQDIFALDKINNEKHTSDREYICEYANKLKQNYYNKN